MITDEWLTPREILAPLGEFDLDPCAPAIRPWDTAKHHYSPPTNGLQEPWFGRVWLNSPFGAQAAHWLEKMAAHGNGIALIPARTETKMFYRHVWKMADAVLFIRGRPHFCYVDGTPAKANSGAPIALVAYGRNNAVTLTASGLGVTVHWQHPDVRPPEQLIIAEKEPRATASQGLGDALAGMSRRASANSEASVWYNDPDRPLWLEARMENGYLIPTGRKRPMTDAERADETPTGNDGLPF